MAVTVGIDIGTTSVKAVAADEDGTVVARTRIPHRIGVPAPDRLEHDANRAWRWGPRRALAGLHRRDVKAVSVVAMVPSLTAVNKNGIPQTPGLLYGDHRGAGAPSEIEGFAAWAAAEYPDAAGLWPAQAVANHTLGGEAVVDMSAAGACWGLFGGAIDSALIPRMAGMGEAIGTVQGSDAVLDAGGVDAVGEQLVAGAHNQGDVHVMLGTTLIVWVVVPEHREVPGLNSIPHLGVPGLTLLGGPSNAGGLFLNWVSSLLGRGRAIFNPDHVPVWVPYPRGERSPIDDPSRRAELHGLDLTHGPAGLRRAAYEASGFVVRRFIDLAGVTATRVVATGGGVHDGEWVQAIADATNLPVDVTAVPEGAALGAAWLARMAAGLESDMGAASRWSATARTVAPDALWADAMTDRYERFRAVAD
ncbi:MAG TPA: FGGY-family carbohydrate kinase [Acidimicrobiales bacterium]|nr:FGGY-family carbohydrate kinase [Acidimicrobiales bacterium]